MLFVFFDGIAQIHGSATLLFRNMKTPLLLLSLLLPGLAIAQFTTTGAVLHDNVERKALRLHNLRSATNPKQCGTDTVEYVLYKTTQFNSISIRRGSALGQYYPAPQTMTVKGFQFYAWALQTTPARAYTMRLICNLYKAGTDSLPSGSPIASDTITVDTTFGGGTLTRLQKIAVFKKPVTLDYPYIITVETDSVNVGAGVVANSWQNRNGRRENLLVGSVSGRWYKGLNLNISGVTLDADMAMYPIISVKFGTDFTINYDPCYPINDSVRFTNQSKKNVVGSRVYDWYTYNNLERFNHLWNPGINPFSNFSSINFIQKYSTKANYDVRLITTHRPWATTACIDTTIKRIYFRPGSPLISGRADACKGDTVTAKAAVDAGATVRWFRKFSDTTAFLTSSDYTINGIAANDTVYVQAVNGNCLSSKLLWVTRVSEYPGNPTVRNDSVCSGSAANLSARSTAGTMEWYNAASGGSLVYTGDVLSTGLLFKDTSFWVQADNNGCLNKGGRVLVQALVGSQFAPDAPEVVRDTAVCLRPMQEVVLPASHKSGNLRWYDVPSGGTPIAGGDTFRFTPAARRDYNWYVDNFNGTCASSRVSIRVAVGDYPNISNKSGSTVCAGDSMDFSAAVPFGTLRWYTSDTAQNPVFEGSQIRSLHAAGTVRWYLESRSGICVAPTRETVTGQVNAPPSLSGINAPTICSRGTALLNANTSFGTVRWYDDPDTDIPLASGNTYRTPSLLGTTTYYVQSEHLGCVSTRVPVTVRVNPRPAAGFTWTLSWQRRVVCTPISTAGVTSFWDFGDGKTSTANVGVNVYAVNGTYTVRLIQTNIATGCKDTADIPVVANHTGVQTIEMQALSVYPNPLSAGESFRFSGALATAPVQALYITDMTGRVVFAGGNQQGTDLRIPASLLPGLYQIQARSGGSWYSARIQVQ